MEDYIFMQESLAGSLDESVKEEQGSMVRMFIRSTSSVSLAWRCDISASAPRPADRTVLQEFPDGRGLQNKNATMNQHLRQTSMFSLNNLRLELKISLFQLLLSWVLKNRSCKNR